MWQCPHDGICPLHHSSSSSLICSFSQRLQRPSFLRKIKHVRAGHEDIGYTYVVIKRGSRPTAPLLKKNTSISENDTEKSIRMEAYDWPRLVFPPLKKSGHVILDGCTKEGGYRTYTSVSDHWLQFGSQVRSWGWQSLVHRENNRTTMPGNPLGETFSPMTRRILRKLDFKHQSRIGTMALSYRVLISGNGKTKHIGSK